MSNVADGDTTNYAVMDLAANVLGLVYVQVDLEAVVGAGTPVGFVVEVPGSLLQESLLAGVAVSTYLNGILQETLSGGGVLQLGTLGVSLTIQYIEATTTKSFDAVRLTYGGLAGLSSAMYAYYPYSGSMETNLPVELVSFDAVADARGVWLHWATLGEVSNSGFEVQHRVGDVFEAMAFVEGAGTTTEARQYSHFVDGLPPGRHLFRLKQVDFDGQYTYSPVVEAHVEVPARALLTAAYPNPFNPQTQFSLVLQADEQVRITVYDGLGRRVRVLHEGRLQAGQMHSFTFEAGALPSGSYMIRVEGTDFVASRPVLLVK